MYKKTIKFVNENGEEETKVIAFNYTKSEIANLQLGTSGGYIEELKNKRESGDKVGLLETFKNFILDAYGEFYNGKIFTKKSFADGHPLKYEFEYSEAFSELYLELLTDDKASMEFVANVMPVDADVRENLISKSGNIEELEAYANGLANNKSEN